MKYIDIHTHKEYLGKQSDYLSIINSEKYRDDAFISMGIHPWNAGKTLLDEKLRFIESFIGNVNFLAVGETGLDKLCKTDLQLQIDCFSKQIALAERYRKPIIVHCVKAYQEVLSMLRNFSFPVIFHNFQKSFELADTLLNRGYYLSFGKALLDSNDKLKRVFQSASIDNIFLETDDSSIGIEELYLKAAELKNISEESISAAIFKNLKRVFNDTF